MPTSVESFTELIGLILIFVVVLVAATLTAKFVAGKQIAQKRMGNFELIETYAVAQNKYLQLLRMGDKYVVISITKDSISFVTELEESEICRIQKDTSVQGKTFKEILSGFTKDKTK